MAFDETRYRGSRRRPAEEAVDEAERRVHDLLGSRVRLTEDALVTRSVDTAERRAADAIEHGREVGELLSMEEAEQDSLSQLMDDARLLRGSATEAREGTTEWYGQQALEALEREDLTLARLCLSLGYLRHTAREAGHRDGERHYLDEAVLTEMSSSITGRTSLDDRTRRRYAFEIEHAQARAEADFISSRYPRRRGAAAERSARYNDAVALARTRLESARREFQAALQAEGSARAARSRQAEQHLRDARRVLGMALDYIELLESMPAAQRNSFQGAGQIAAGFREEAEGRDGRASFDRGRVIFEFDRQCDALDQRVGSWSGRAMSGQRTLVTDMLRQARESLASAEEGSDERAQSLLGMARLYVSSMDDLGESRRARGAVRVIAPGEGWGREEMEAAMRAAMRGETSVEGTPVEEHFVSGWRNARQTSLGRHIERLSRLSRAQRTGHETLDPAISEARRRAAGGDLSGAARLIGMLSDYYAMYEQMESGMEWPRSRDLAVSGGDRRAPSLATVAGIHRGRREMLAAISDEMGADTDEERSAALERFRGGAARVALTNALREMFLQAQRTYLAMPAALRDYEREQRTARARHGLEPDPRLEGREMRELLIDMEAAARSGDVAAYNQARRSFRERSELVASVAGERASVSQARGTLEAIGQGEGLAGIGRIYMEAYGRPGDDLPTTLGRMPREARDDLRRVGRPGYTIESRGERGLERERRELLRLIGEGNWDEALQRRYAEFLIDVEAVKRRASTVSVIRAQRAVSVQHRQGLVRVGVSGFSLTMASDRLAQSERQLGEAEGHMLAGRVREAERSYRRAMELRAEAMGLASQLSRREGVGSGTAWAQRFRSYIDGQVGLFHDLIEGRPIAPRAMDGFRAIEMATLMVPSTAAPQIFEDFSSSQAQVIALVQRGRTAEATRLANTMMARVRDNDFYAELGLTVGALAVSLVPGGQVIGGAIFTSIAFNHCVTEQLTSGHVSAASLGLLGLTVATVGFGQAISAIRAATPVVQGTRIPVGIRSSRAAFRLAGADARAAFSAAREEAREMIRFYQEAAQIARRSAEAARSAGDAAGAARFAAQARTARSWAIVLADRLPTGVELTRAGAWTAGLTLGNTAIGMGFMLLGAHGTYAAYRAGDYRRALLMAGTTLFPVFHGHGGQAVRGALSRRGLAFSSHARIGRSIRQLRPSELMSLEELSGADRRAVTSVGRTLEGQSRGISEGERALADVPEHLRSDVREVLRRSEGRDPTRVAQEVAMERIQRIRSAYQSRVAELMRADSEGLVTSDEAQVIAAAESMLRGNSPEILGLQASVSERAFTMCGEAMFERVVRRNPSALQLLETGREARRLAVRPEEIPARERAPAERPSEPSEREARTEQLPTATEELAVDVDLSGVETPSRSGVLERGRRALADRRASRLERDLARLEARERTETAGLRQTVRRQIESRRAALESDPLLLAQRDTRALRSRAVRRIERRRGMEDGSIHRDAARRSGRESEPGAAEQAVRRSLLESMITNDDGLLAEIGISDRNGLISQLAGDEALFNLLTRGDIEGVLLRGMRDTSGRRISGSGARIIGIRRIGGTTGAYEMTVRTAGGESMRAYVKTQSTVADSLVARACRAVGILAPRVIATDRFGRTLSYRDAFGRRREFGIYQDIADVRGRVELGVEGTVMVEHSFMVQDIASRGGMSEGALEFWRIYSTAEGRQQIFEAWMTYQERARRIGLPDRHMRNTTIHLIRRADGTLEVRFGAIDLDLGFNSMTTRSARPAEPGVRTDRYDHTLVMEDISLATEQFARTLYLRGEGGVAMAGRGYIDLPSIGEIVSGMFSPTTMEAVARAARQLRDPLVQRRLGRIVRSADGHQFGLGRDVEAPISWDITTTPERLGARITSLFNYYFRTSHDRIALERRGESLVGEVDGVAVTVRQTGEGAYQCEFSTQIGINPKSNAAYDGIPSNGRLRLSGRDGRFRFHSDEGLEALRDINGQGADWTTSFYTRARQTTSLRLITNRVASLHSGSRDHGFSRARAEDISARMRQRIEDGDSLRQASREVAEQLLAEYGTIDNVFGIEEAPAEAAGQ